MIRIITGPPELTFQLDVSAELMRLRVTWRNPETGKPEKAVTAAAVPREVGGADRWLVGAVERMAQHVERLSNKRTVVEA